MGEIIAKKRKEAAMTQAELAEHIGVSKPAVSKWESGYSLPDISLLPVLASFFDISIDELMGYHPQMHETNISVIYEKLVKDLDELPADTVFSECRAYISKYYFCWKLILKMSQFMYNHYTLSTAPQEVLQEIIRYTKRIRRQCDDNRMEREANYLTACCLIHLNALDDAQKMLEDLLEPMTNAPVLLAYIYDKQGKRGDAQKIITDLIEQHLQLILSAIPSACMYSDETGSVCYIQKYSALLTLLEADKNYPDHLLRYYYALSMMYCRLKNKKAALEYLCKFSSFLENVMHYEPKSNLTNKQFGDQMILETIVCFTAENEAFRILHDEEQYQKMIEQLKKLLEEYNGSNRDF